MSELRELRPGYRGVIHDKPFQYEEDGLHVTRSCAWSGPGCHEGCGVLIYTDDNGKLVKIEGDPDNPFNEGRLCPRCLDLDEVTYHKDRLLYPMKRAKEDRGKDAFERITWDEAYDIIYERFTEIKEKYGAQAVFFDDGTGRDSMLWITRLCWSFGSPNYVFHMSGQACYGPRMVGTHATTGSFWVGDYAQWSAQRYDDPEYELPEYVLVWGNNPVWTSADGMFGTWLVDVMRRGTKIIVIDPRRIWLANRAEVYMPIRPGTDAALALGLMHVIIEEDIYDHEFVDKWCYGFDELAERVKEWTPEKTAEVCWLDADQIVDVARKLANAKSWILQWGVAIDMTKETLPANQALISLFAICGDIDIPGGMIAPVSVLFYLGGWGKEFLPEDQKANRIIGDSAVLKNFSAACSTDEIINTLESGKPYKLHAAWLQTTNFLACAGPDPKRTLAAYKGLDFIAAVDIFMTPTIMALADVVLPAATYPERNGLMVGDGLQRGATLTKVIQVGECKSDMQINLELGKRFNPEAWPWADDVEMFSEILKPTGFSFNEVQESAPIFIPFEYHRHEKGKLRKDGQVGFNTPTGRIELWCTFYEKMGLDPLPSFEEPESQYSYPELADEYPLILTTGARNISMFHSEHRQIPRLRAMHPWPVVQVHPECAEKYGLVDGQWAWVENQRGRCKRVVEVTNLISDPRVVNIDHAWWLPEAEPEEDKGLFGLWDMACNQLIPYRAGSSGYGCNYRSFLCKVYMAKEDDDD